MIDIEAIRVSAELTAYSLVESMYPGAREKFPRLDVAAKRRSLLGSSLLLTDAMAPEAMSAAREAMATLGVNDAIELYQTDWRFDSARLALYGEPIGIEFLGGYLGNLDRGGVLAVIGHEIGHALAHSNHPRFAWVFARSQRPATADESMYAIAAEMTADRFGLLACGDLAAALRVDMLGVAGAAGSKSIRLDANSYLDQCKAFGEELYAGTGEVRGITHPEHYIRSYAEWLFSETDFFRSATGKGSGSRTMRDVDEILTTLLGRAGELARARRAAKPATVATAPVASVGQREDEADLRRKIPSLTLEDVAIDILTDGTRRNVAGAVRAVSEAARNAAPSLGRLSTIAAGHFRARRSSDATPDESALLDEDPLAEDRRDLEARFEELERRDREK